MNRAADPDWTAHRHRRVWALAFPIMLANVSIPLVGAVDTAVMGHLPDEKFIGAVAIGAVIFSFVYWGFGFLRMGTTGFVAQAFGARDHDEMANAFTRAVLLGAGVGVLLVLLQWPVGRLSDSMDRGLLLIIIYGLLSLSAAATATPLRRSTTTVSGCAGCRRTPVGCRWT